MMLGLRRRYEPGIGVDLGTAAIKMVEIEKKGAGHRIRTAVRTATPEGALADGAIVKAGELAGVLGEMVARHGWHKRAVVTAIGGRKVITRHIRLPVMPEKELASAVKWEAEKYLPFGNQDLVMDYQSLGEMESEGKKQLLILVAAVPAELARAYYDLMSTVQLELVAIDIIPTALARWAVSPAGMGLPRTSRFAVVDLGEEVSNFVISVGEQVVFSRVIPFGGSQITQVVAQIFNKNLEEARHFKEENVKLLENEIQMDETAVSAEETQVDFAIRSSFGDLVRELRRSLDFYRTQSPGAQVAKLLLTGGTSLLPGLDRFLAQELGLQVEVGIVQAEGVGEHQVILDAGFALATGLALRG